jgi:hypothetical protein
VVGHPPPAAKLGRSRPRNRDRLTPREMRSRPLPCVRRHTCTRPKNSRTRRRAHFAACVLLSPAPLAVVRDRGPVFPTDLLHEKAPANSSSSFHTDLNTATPLHGGRPRQCSRNHLLRYLVRKPLDKRLAGRYNGIRSPVPEASRLPNRPAMFAVVSGYLNPADMPQRGGDVELSSTGLESAHVMKTDRRIG